LEGKFQLEPLNIGKRASISSLRPFEGIFSFFERRESADFRATSSYKS
jgi:hypothetical protein